MPGITERDQGRWFGDFVILDNSVIQQFQIPRSPNATDFSTDMCATRMADCGSSGWIHRGWWCRRHDQNKKLQVEWIAQHRKPQITIQSINFVFRGAQRILKHNSESCRLSRSGSLQDIESLISNNYRVDDDPKEWIGWWWLEGFIHLLEQTNTTCSKKESTERTTPAMIWSVLFIWGTDHDINGLS